MTKVSVVQAPDRRRFLTASIGGRVPSTLTMTVRCPYCGAPPGKPCRDPYSGRKTELLAHPSRADKAGIPKLPHPLESLRPDRD